MKEDYPLVGSTTQVTLKLESEVAEKLKQMADFTKFSDSEIANTAIKRFIATHSDFLPSHKK